MGNHEFETLVYFPLVEDEEEDVKGWDKMTVDYAINNKLKILGQIRAIARTMRKDLLQTADVEDIYSEILLYLHNCSDYDINKAISRSSGDSIVSLEGYLNSCIKYCVLRKCTSMNKFDRETLPEVAISNESDEISVFSNISDKISSSQMDDIFYNLADLCKSFECWRYKYGPDIYQVLFVRLLTLNSKKRDMYNDILEALGVSKLSLNDLESNSTADDLMQTFTRAVCYIPIEQAINIIRPYVYSADKIEQAVRFICNSSDKSEQLQSEVETEKESSSSKEENEASSLSDSITLDDGILIDDMDISE